MYNKSPSNMPSFNRQPDPSVGATRALLVEAREYALPSTQGPGPGLEQGQEQQQQRLGQMNAAPTPTITAAGIFLLGAYYRPLCLCMRDQECVDMGRRLCMLLGR